MFLRVVEEGSRTLHLTLGRCGRADVRIYMHSAEWWDMWVSGGGGARLTSDKAPISAALHIVASSRHFTSLELQLYLVLGIEVSSDLHSCVSIRKSNGYNSTIAIERSWVSLSSEGSFEDIYCMLS